MRRLVMVLAAVATVVVGGGALYLWFAGGSGEPTTELTTPTLASDTRPTTTAAGVEAPTSTTVPDEPAPSGSVAFEINQDGSQAMFELDEELRGVPTHVVGTTSEVAGQLRLDPSDLSTAELSPIVVNARTFQTDSATRDRAIRGPVVLNSASDEFELITFTPRSIDGLEGPAEVGDTVDFTVTGDLTIKGTTRPVTFDVEVTWVEEDRLEGTAVTTVDRTDFGIGIPNVASVANVTEAVDLTLVFVARSPSP